MDYPKLTNLDSHQITAYGFDEEKRAHRMVLVGSDNLNITANIDTSKKEDPIVITNTEIKVIEVPKIITETIYKEIDKPIIIEKEKIIEVIKEVPVEKIVYKEIDKPIIIEKTEYKEVNIPNWLKLGLVINTIAIVLLAIIK